MGKLMIHMRAKLGNWPSFDRRHEQNWPRAQVTNDELCATVLVVVHGFSPRAAKMSCGERLPHRAVF